MTIRTRSADLKRQGITGEPVVADMTEVMRRSLEATPASISGIAGCLQFNCLPIRAGGFPNVLDECKRHFLLESLSGCDKSLGRIDYVCRVDARSRTN